MADVKRRRSRRAAAGNFLTLAALASRDCVESNYEVEFRFSMQIQEYIERRSGEPKNSYFCRKCAFCEGLAADNLNCTEYLKAERAL